MLLLAVFDRSEGWFGPDRVNHFVPWHFGVVKQDMVLGYVVVMTCHPVRVMMHWLMIKAHSSEIIQEPFIALAL